MDDLEYLFVLCILGLGVITFLGAFSPSDEQDDLTFGDLFENMMLENMNESQKQAYHAELNKTVSYNVTILDKRYDEDLLFNDYTVTYKENGKIKQENNMDLFYSVEKGHEYNFTYDYYGKRIKIEG